MSQLCNKIPFFLCPYSIICLFIKLFSIIDPSAFISVIMRHFFSYWTISSLSTRLEHSFCTSLSIAWQELMLIKYCSSSPQPPPKKEKKNREGEKEGKRRKEAKEKKE